MDRNLLLAFALSFLVLTTWTMLTEGEREPLPPGSATESPESPTSPAPFTPLPTSPTADIPPPTAVAPIEVAPAVPTPAPEPSFEERIVEVRGDLYEASFTNRGGALRSWTLSEQSGYDAGASHDHEPLVLTTGVAPYDLALATPLTEIGLGDLSRVPFTVESASDAQLVFVYESGGVTVRKRYDFEPDTYSFRLSIDVENGSDQAIEPRFGVYLPAHSTDGEDFREQAIATVHEGELEQKQLGQLGSGGIFGIGGSPDPVYEYPNEVDWVGIQTTYFLSALLPDAPAQAWARLITTQPGVAGLAEVSYPPVRISPGQSVTREFRGYFGPKEAERLAALGGEALRSIDLGWSWVRPLTRIFGGLLRGIYQVVPNYGVAIILLTMLVRLVMIPLTNKQMRSMERMRALQPKIKELQEKHKDDRQKQSEAMMALYRQEKVNPLGGCLPMVLQLPVFIGLFYALRSSIDLRQAPFFGWIDDLSAPETLFEIPGLGLPVRVLPLLMAASMYFQQKITPMQMDPAQARMMTTIMPLMMLFFFYTFPSGLVLYWMVTNVLAISHQVFVGRRMKQSPA